MKCEILRSSDKIEIRLINTKNLFCFYLASISSGDFYMLRREQDIRVDYERFIKKLVEMVHYISKGDLIGIFQDQKLLFVERNDFRNIVRFELKFTKPEEMEYKRYLADVVGRLEMDNVKLVKENIQMKEQIKIGDRENNNKIKSLEKDYCESQRKIEKLYNEISRLEESKNQRDKELEKNGEEIKKLEIQMNELKRELERKKINEVKNEGLAIKIEEMKLVNENLENEISIANGIIKKLKTENRELKDKISTNDIEMSEYKKSKQKSKKEIDELKKINRNSEEKIQKFKENIQNLEYQIQKYESEKKELIKKLENAQTVYSHFYSKNPDEESATKSDINSGISSIQPESPPR